MRFPLIFTVLLVTAALTRSTGASAQAALPPEDWVVTRLADKDAVIASVPFNNGITLVSRCAGQVFDVMIMGLPEARRGTVSRPLTFLVGDETDEKPYAWTVGSDRTSAFSRIPALIARSLAEGGKLQIIVPGERGAPRTRYVMDLGPSGAAVEETLTHCGRALVDPRDDQLEGDGDGLPNGIVWARTPRPEFPSAVQGRSPVNGYVGLTCLVAAEGRLDACEIESEQPVGYNLGRSVLRSLGAARLGQTDEARAAGRRFEGAMIVFTVNFRLQ
jgi:hypothetical protein